MKDIVFDTELLETPGLSPEHLVRTFERTAGPLVKLTQMLKDDAARLSEFRAAFRDLIAMYWRDNLLHQQFLMTRALKR